MNVARIFAGSLLALALAGCGKPVPAEKSAYVGKGGGST
jgi:hypothetical protein